MKTYRKSEASWSHNRNQKMTTTLYSNKVILPPFPPLGEGGEGGRGGPNFVVTLASKHFTKCTRLYLSDFLPTCGYEQAVHPPYQCTHKTSSPPTVKSRSVLSEVDPFFETTFLFFTPNSEPEFSRVVATLPSFGFFTPNQNRFFIFLAAFCMVNFNHF